MVFKEMTPSQAEMMYSYCKSDSAVSRSRSLCKIKSNIVTKPLDDWKSLFYQRVRWASKTTSYQSAFGQVLGLVVFYWESQYCCGLWLMDYGFIIATDYLFVNST
jgi:hypothetical protein